MRTIDMDNSETEEVYKLITKIVGVVNEYVDAEGGSESTKVAIAMTAVTKVLAGIAVSIGVPEQLAHDALDAEIELFAGALADSEHKH
jgi:hypothetical protein